MNDGGSPPVLYAFDSSGVLMDSIVVTNASNIDWEALGNDGVDRFFIGDFGNNNNDRTDLRLYIVDSIGSGSLLHADTMQFSYPDQTSFPASANFDMEGMFYFSDSLYLFSRNKLFGGNGFTKLYSLPAQPGSFTARLIDSLDIGVVVTGSDLSPDGQTVALMSYGRIIILEGFSGTNFLNGTQRYIIIPISQTESVAFLDDSTLYFTNEEGSLFTLGLSDPSNGMELLENCCESFYDQPSGCWSIRVPHACTYELIENTGRVMLSGKTDHETLTFTREQFGVGVFWLSVAMDHRQQVLKLIFW